MRILDVYIIKELIRPFLFGMCAFSSAFIGGGTMFRIAQYISKYGASSSIVVQMFLFSLPKVIVITIPMSMLLASLLCFGSLSGNSEIIAMKASGQSFQRIVTPIIIIAFLIAVSAVFANESIVPMSTAAYNRIIRNEIQGSQRQRSEDHVVMIDKEADNAVNLTYASKFDGATNSMRDVTVQKYENNKLVMIERAEKAVWESNRWVMYAGVINELSGEGTRILYFDQQVMPINKSPDDISIEQKKPEEMTIKELKQRIKMFAQLDVARNIYAVELHQRIAIPMSTVIFAIIGAALGLAPHRSSSSTGLGLSIIIIFVYYSLMMFSTTLGQTGKLIPALAAWLPNLVGGSLGAYLVSKER